MRELNIINDLLKSNDYLSLEFFINKHSVSKRTLQNEFSYLANIANVKGFNLIQKRGRGYLLEIENKTKFNNFVAELTKLYSNPKVSAENIVAYISLNEHYETTENLIEIFKSSKSTIKSYKDEVDQFLKNYNLVMERKAHYGLRVDSTLKERRNLLVDLYSKNNQIVKTAIGNDIDDDFEEVKDSLISTLKKQDLIINYTELAHLVAWLKVTIYINSKLDTPVCDHQESEIVDTIIEKFKVNFTLNDIEDFENLINNKSRNNANTDENLDVLKKHINDFLIDIDVSNQTHFNEDEEFKRLLITHVSLLINRLSFKVSYSNPIIDELLIKYPMVFNIAISLGDLLKEKYDVSAPKDEIGFVATYFILHMEKEVIHKLKKYNKIAIVCSSGGGSAYLIKLKMENLFSSAIIETFSLLQMNELENFNPDIIFSITNLNITTTVPVIFIKELLDDYDILNIKQLVMFEKFDKAFVDKTKEYYIQRFFDPEFFMVDNKSTDYIKCLKDMSSEIESGGIGGHNYSENVLKRESFASTVYLNGIAIPHSIEMNANKDLISVKIFKKPVSFQGKKVSIIFMISLRKENLVSHEGITNDLFEIMNDLETVQALVKSGSFKEFIAQIKKKG